MSKEAPKLSALRAVGLVRVSTDDQLLGADAQRAAIREWCSRHKVTLVGIREDLGVSGTADLSQRLGLQGAFRDLVAKDAGILLVAKQDRLSRDPFLSENIRRMVARLGGAVVSADGTANGTSPEAVFLRGILDQVALLERNMISARTKAALQARKAKGLSTCGRTPFGFKREGGRYVPAEDQQRVIAAIYRLHQEGCTFEEITEVLNRDRIPAPPPRPSWKKTFVFRIYQAEMHRRQNGGK